MDAGGVIHDALPGELVVECFEFCDFKTIAATCSSVCKQWNRLTNQDILWQHLFARDMPGIELKTTEGDNMESLREVYPNACEWRRAYIYFNSIPFRWSSHYNSEYLWTTHEGKGVFHAEGDSTHMNMFGDKSFSSGRHRWSLRVLGLDNSYWIAVGVSLGNTGTWSYGSTKFIGSNSVGNMMGPQENKISAAPSWQNGDVVSVDLDCDAHTVTIIHNGFRKVPLEIPNQPVWPWVNIFEQGASVMLIPWAERQ